jgi:YVTN family beta-propeller protein
MKANQEVRFTPHRITAAQLGEGPIIRKTSVLQRWLGRATLAACATVLMMFVVPTPVRSDAGQARLPTGQYLTPTATPGSHFQRLQTLLRTDGGADADGAVTSLVSPDGTALLVLTSGYDTTYYAVDGSPIVHHVLDPMTVLPSTTKTPAAQWVFVYDIRGAVPRVVQRLNIPLSYNGIVWDPRGLRFFVSGGPDDRVYIFKTARGPAVSAAQSWVPDAPFIALDHNSNPHAPLSKQDGGALAHTPAGAARGARTQNLPFSAVAAGLAISADGATLYVANMQNDSISVIDLAKRRVSKEIRFFKPGDQTARGEYPFWIVVKSAPSGGVSKIYTSSLRDGEIMVTTARAQREIRVGGEPNKMVLAPDGRYLFVANGDLDAVDVIDTNDDHLAHTISLRRPNSPYLGANPNALALNSDGSVLYVTLGGENALVVIDTASDKVLGRIPTGWYPSSVSVGLHDRMLYVINTRSPSGATRLKVDDADNTAPLANGVNGYVYNLEKAGLLSFPPPEAATLQHLTKLVDTNNGFGQQQRSDIMTFLHTKIKHVIYVMKENRTYDQVLGDLPHGNGDPRLVQFGKLLTPNNHRLATEFVTLDNFYASGDVSADGWSWTFQGRANDYNAKSVAFDYGNGGFPYDWEGEPRGVNLSLPVFGPPTPYGERITTLFDPSGSSTILPGTKDIGATEGAGDLQPSTRGGFIWDAVLRAGLTHRHYGIYTSLNFYDRNAHYYLPISRTAFAAHLVQAVPVQSELWGRTDLYYRGWDLDVPDQYRYEEWKREFDGYVLRGDLPNFEVVDLMNDHFGNFKTNVGGLTTPESQIAMNDYALGELVAAVATSRYWKDTAIFVVEDDAQDGPDHVDAHRTVAHVISAFTKRGKVISTFYSTVSMLRTMEDILAVDHLGIFDANASPMSDVFTSRPDLTRYTPIIPGILCRAPVKRDLVPGCADITTEQTAPVTALHDVNWWAEQTRGFNFHQPDAIDSRIFNRILWVGTKGANTPFPEERLQPTN